MSEWVIDTNVPIVANGRPGLKGPRLPSLACREAAVEFLRRIVNSETVLVDHEGAIQAEYRTHLRPSGQPGVGDRFYQVVLQSSPERVRRVALPRRPDGEYASLPEPLIAVRFDPSDRKFAALAKQENATVVNATDSDWINDQVALTAAGIRVHNVCGYDQTTWFAA